MDFINNSFPSFFSALITIHLYRIVETMSYNDNVANFLEAQAELDNVPMADLEMVAGDVIERVKSQPNSPFGTLRKINRLID